ncbi:MAG TPA: hypothetical protein VD837_13770 [Terriglobales bacterium]|nr:hypothetical protein [Terriglobales bacterium]
MIDSYGTLNVPSGSLNDYLLKLGFRLLVFRGLDVTRIEPQNVHMIGVPAEVPYEERIFKVSFDLPRTVSTDERVVFEVLSPTGFRLCKFHLDFY